MMGIPCPTAAFAVMSGLLHFASIYAFASGQPRQAGGIGQFEIVGDSLVSGQQLFVGTLNKVYILDKTENNSAQINGHPAWAAEYDLVTNVGRPMDAVTNSFCAGGSVLGNGTWLNVGGNQAVTHDGVADPLLGNGPFGDPDGGQSLRVLDPCDDRSCNWVLLSPMTTRRWYPTVETLEDGSVIILGGCTAGGYVNDASQTNPTYEFFPSTGDPIDSPILKSTLPVNLYALTWLLPSGMLFIQSNQKTVLLDRHLNVETPLDDMPDAVRTYPASAGTAMLPLTPGNNWTATILFCGGTQPDFANWQDPNWIIPPTPTSTSCVTISPDVSGSYSHVDPLPEGRSMGSLIILPTGKLLYLNGANTGTAGYGNQSWAIGQSYADNPVLIPVLYDPLAPAGQMWNRDGLFASTVPRLYHSAATLLPDGSVFIAGSNPNADYTVGPNVTYPTEYRTEIFYPSYYNERRPDPVGLLTQLSYGGPYFNVSLSADDLFGDVQNVQNAQVIVLRFGFSTHAINFGQRFVQLNSTYTGNTTDGTAVLHVSQLPPNPAIIAPGPAMLFVVVNGVPSIGSPVMVGSGQLGQQPVLAAIDIPVSNMTSSAPTPTPSASTSNHKSSASRVHIDGAFVGWWFVLGVLSLFC
jgi:hypothetical protein